MKYHLKNSLATWGLVPASPVISQQLCCPLGHHAIQN